MPRPDYLTELYRRAAERRDAPHLWEPDAFGEGDSCAVCGRSPSALVHEEADHAEAV
jgi:hypothetical protein